MSRKHSTALGISAAAAGAAVAAFFSMGTANADPFVDPYVITPGVVAAGDITQSPDDAYDMLFGAQGVQGVDNMNLDVSTAEGNLSGYESFTTAVAAFEANPAEHGLENLIFALDPSAFYEQTTAGVVGTIADSGGAYLAPDSFLGYLATGLDYGLLTPTGLNFVLTPLIDILVGAPLGS
jgi:hypothetical protein